MHLKYLKIAREEFHDAIKYYETQQIDLGIKFKSDIRSSIDRIAAMECNGIHEVQICSHTSINQ